MVWNEEALSRAIRRPAGRRTFSFRFRRDLPCRGFEVLQPLSTSEDGSQGPSTRDP